MMEFDNLCCAVCHNNYEKDDLTFLYNHLCCVYCAEEWQKYKSNIHEDYSGQFEKWAIKFREQLESEK